MGVVLFFQYPGWTLTPQGSLFMATVNDDAAGVYTCTPTNSYGSMGSSGRTNVILKVSEHPGSPGSGSVSFEIHSIRQPTFPDLYTPAVAQSTGESVLLVLVKQSVHSPLCFLINHNGTCHSALTNFTKTTFYWPFRSDVWAPPPLMEVNFYSRQWKHCFGS